MSRGSSSLGSSSAFLADGDERPAPEVMEWIMSLPSGGKRKLYLVKHISGGVSAHPVDANTVPLLPTHPSEGLAYYLVHTTSATAARLAVSDIHYPPPPQALQSASGGSDMNSPRKPRVLRDANVLVHPLRHPDDAAGVVVVDDKDRRMPVRRTGCPIQCVTDREEFLDAVTRTAADHKKQQLARLQAVPFPTVADLHTAIAGWRVRGMLADERLLGSFADGGDDGHGTRN